MIYMTVNM